MRGRKPVPTALKLMRGNPGHRPINVDEPKSESGAEMPDWLSADAQKRWLQLYRNLDEAGVLTQLDAMALGMLCEQFAIWADASAKVAKFGLVYKGQGGQAKESPYLKIANKSMERIQKLLVEFGMTPASRTRISTATKKKKEGKFSRFRVVET